MHYFVVVNVQTMMDRLGYKTKQQLADKLGVTQGLISQWAGGKSYPSYHIIKQLIALGATTEEIFGIPCNCHLKINDVDYPNSGANSKQDGSGFVTQSQLNSLKSEIEAMRNSLDMSRKQAG